MPSMTLIETKTVGAGGVSSLDFVNIPQTFTDLVVVRSMRASTTTGPAMSANITFNNSASGYSERLIYNNSTGGVATGTRSGTFFDWCGMTPTSWTSNQNVTFGSSSIYVANYTSANNKVVFAESIQENNSSSGADWNQYIVSGTWANTNAITSLKLTASAGVFLENSTVSLYGVKSATIIEQAPALGGIFYKSGGYWYHVFTSSGTFTPSGTITADVLMIGGGGGGGYNYGGGGSAGSVALYTGQVIGNPKTVTIGAGGGSGYYNNGNGGSGYAGGTTSFTGLTNAAGGAGGTQGAAIGGSGAGGARSGQNGGPGVNTYSTWASATGTGVSGYYAGGGGGGNYSTTGAGGSGGGGFGGAYTNGQYGGDNGVANTGSGGGGGYSGSGAGGSGLVIVRYAV